MVVSTSPSHEPLARLAAPTSMGSTELVLHQLLPQQPIIYYIIKGLVFWRWLTTVEIVAFFFWAKGIRLLNTCCALGATCAHFILITAQVFVFLFYRWGNWGSERLNNISGISQALARIGFEPMSVSLSLIASLGLSDTYKAVSWEERESLSSPVVALPSLSGFTLQHLFFLNTLDLRLPLKGPWCGRRVLVSFFPWWNWMSLLPRGIAFLKRFYLNSS